MIKRIIGWLLFGYFALVPIAAFVSMPRPHGAVEISGFVGGILLAIAIAAIGLQMALEKKKPPED